MSNLLQVNEGRVVYANHVTELPVNHRELFFVAVLSDVILNVGYLRKM